MFFSFLNVIQGYICYLGRGKDTVDVDVAKKQACRKKVVQEGTEL